MFSVFNKNVFWALGLLTISFQIFAMHDEDEIVFVVKNQHKRTKISEPYRLVKKLRTIRSLVEVFGKEELLQDGITFDIERSIFGHLLNIAELETEEAIRDYIAEQELNLADLYEVIKTGKMLDLNTPIINFEYKGDNSLLNIFAEKLKELPEGQLDSVVAMIDDVDIRNELSMDELKLLRIFEGGQEIDLSPDSQHCIIKYQDNNRINMYNVATNQITEMSDNQNLVENVAKVYWSPDGQHCIIQYQDNNRIRMYNVATNQIIEMSDNQDLVENVAKVYWSPDGKHCIIRYNISNDFRIRMYNVATNQITEMSDNQNLVKNVAKVYWSPDGKHCIIRYGNFYDDILIYNVETNQITEISNQNPVEDVDEVYWSPDSQHCIIKYSTSSRIRMYNVATNQITEMSDNQNLVRGIDTIYWSPDGQRSVIKYSNYKIRMYNVETNEITEMSDNQDLVGYVIDVYWSPDGQDCIIQGGISGYLNKLNNMSIYNTITNKVTLLSRSKIAQPRFWMVGSQCCIIQLRKKLDEHGILVSYDPKAHKIAKIKNSKEILKDIWWNELILLSGNYLESNYRNRRCLLKLEDNHKLRKAFDRSDAAAQAQ